MKRARRQTVRRGLQGSKRRRLAKRLRDIRRGWGPGCYAYQREPCTFRDARRLHEAGLAVAVGSKGSLDGGGVPREITLFRTREEALRQYPRTALMQRRGRF